MKSRLLVVVILLMMVAWGEVRAQTVSTAQINGTIRDVSGAVLPGVEVAVTQVDTGLKRSILSDENGSYSITNLPVGPYRLEAALAGFRTYVQTGIVLQVGINPTINAVLQVGQITETIEVEANAVMVESQSTGLGTVIDNKRVLELPLNGRNATELIFLSGMANVGGPADSALRTLAPYPTVPVSVAGGVGNSVLFLLDGAVHLETHTALNLPLPFPDALQEFKVETSALPAQYGDHASATVNAVTKAGTNDFHGDVFEFVRNGVFNARNFFAAQRDTLKRNQLGAAVGGPIRKNKLFFFGGYQGTFERSQPPTSIAYVPTAAMLAGDFSAVASPACNSNRQITLSAAQGFVNNTISPSRFDPVALKIVSLLPTTNDQCGQVFSGLRANQNENLTVGRLDYQSSAKHSIFGRFLMTDLNQPSTYDGKNPLTIFNDQNHDRLYSLVLGDTYLMGSGAVNTIRAGMNRFWDERAPDHFYSWASLGAQNVLSSGDETVRFQVTGNGFTIGGGSSMPYRYGLHEGPHINLVDDVSLIKGGHQIGFGANYLRIAQNFFSNLNSVGAITISGQLSGMPLADFLLGNASTWSQGTVYGYAARQHSIGLYIQDSWKLTGRLRVNYGVRWEPYLPPYEKNRRWVHYDPNLFAQNVRSTVYVNAPAGLIFPGDPQYTIGNHPEGNSWDHFLPRVGLVWDPKGDGRMTIRAGYGMFTDRQHLGTGYAAFWQNSPTGNNVSLTNVQMSNPWANYPGGNPFPLALGKNQPFSLFSNYRTDPFDFNGTYMNQWNLSVQRQVGSDWLVTVNYAGNSTIHLVTSTQLNAAQYLGLGPCTINNISYATCSTTANQNQRRAQYLQNPTQGQYYAALVSLDDGGTANYNGLLVSVQKRLSRGVSVLANDTWSHCISDYWEPSLSGFNLPGNRRLNRGNCQTGDQRQVFHLSAVLQSPKFSNRTMALIGNNWQLSPIWKIMSAQFLTVTTGIDNALSGLGNQVPNLVPGVSPYAADKTVDHWLNPAAFTNPLPGTYGDAGRFNLKGPGVFQLDVALSRMFAIREGKTLQLRAEAFNLLNHPSFSTPVATLNSGSFGKIQSDISGTSGLTAGNPRILQFAVKIGF